MKKAIVSIFTLLFLGSGIGFAAVLDFEDLGDITNPQTSYAYKGFNFKYANDYAKPSVDDGTSMWNGTNGGKSIYEVELIYGTDPDDKYYDGIYMSSIDGSEFSLKSFYVTSGYSDYLHTIYFDGYKDGVLIARLYKASAVHSEKYFIDFIYDTDNDDAGLDGVIDWNSIDALRVHIAPVRRVGGITLDDITYNLGGAPPVVPEPGTMLLLGVGVLCLSGLRRRMEK